MTFRQSLLLLVAVSMSVALVACGGSSTMSTTPTPPIAVSFASAAPAALQVDATASLAVVITNDSANAGVKWSVTCGSNGACGSFSTSGPGTSSDRKSTRLNSSHSQISYAVFCLKKKKKTQSGKTETNKIDLQ